MMEKGFRMPYWVRVMCNRVVQLNREIRPGQKIMVKMRGPGGEFELPFEEAVFGGPARCESRNYWIKREGAEDVLIPYVTRYGEKNKTTGEQGYENVPLGMWLEGLLLPQPPGKDYRLLKVLTQPATPEQLATLGNDRAPVFRRMPPEWDRVDWQEYPPNGLLVWTSDFQTVRKGKWQHPEPGAPLDEGKWEDESGEPIAVTRWLPIEMFPDEPPVPTYEPPCKGGIVGFETLRDDNGEQGQLGF